jgi:hypothetical protein
VICLRTVTEAQTLHDLVHQEPVNTYIDPKQQDVSVSERKVESSGVCVYVYLTLYQKKTKTM